VDSLERLHLRFDLDGRAMASTREYREFAEECLRWAASAHIEEHRRMLLDIAKTWIGLEAERRAATERRSEIAVRVALKNADI